MASHADFDEFDAEIREFGEFLNDISRKTAVKSLSNSLSEEDEKPHIKTSTIDDGLITTSTDSKSDVNVAKQDNSDCQSVRGTMEALLALDTLTSPLRAPPFVAPVDSPTLSPPPSFSRLPPDGHEFPPNYHEPSFNVGVPAIIEMPLDQNPADELLKPIQNMTPVLSSSPPPLPASVPPTRKLSEDLPNGRKLSSEERRTQKWHKDEKSEKSVRDKIAMFSSVKDEPVSPAQVPKRINKHGSSDDILNHTEDCSIQNKTMSRSVLSIDRTGKGNTSPSISHDFIRKTPPIFNSMNDVSASVVDCSEPSRTLDFTSRTQSNLDLTSSSSAYSSSGSPDSSLSSMTSSYSYSSTLPRKLSNGYQSSNKVQDSIVQNGTASNLTRTSNYTVGNNLHTRSQSMVDIGSEPYSSRRSSLSQLKTNNDGNTTLSAMMEQRRRGISKLRGLVIPEKVSEVSPSQPIIDLPEIKSRDSILVSKPPQVSGKDTSYSSRPSRWSVDHTANNEKLVVNNVTPSLSSPPWKTQSTLPNLPKYSPAFKRKSLALYGVPSSTSSLSSSRSSSKEELRPLFDNPSTVKNTPPLPPSKPPRNSLQMYNSPFLQQEPPKSLESIVSPTRSDVSFEYVSSNRSSPDYRSNEISKNKILNGDHYIKNSRLSPKNKNAASPDFGRPGEDDSDNDSAVSSSRSSISHGFSPPLSPVPDTNGRNLPDDHNHSHHSILSSLPSSNGSADKRPLRRTLSSETTASAASSTASTLTSGSQASCSSNGGSSSGSDTNKRVLKPQSVEAINRKNVLSSARYSSGKDIKIGSPLIQRKFEDDVIDYSNGDKLEKVNNDDNNKSTTFRYYPKLNADMNSAKISNDLIHYKTSESDDSSIEPTIIYYEVQETDTPHIILDDSNLETGNEKLASINGIEIVEVENLESPVEKSLPQPAPRRTGIPTPVKSQNGKDINNGSTVNDDKWLELQKKYSASNISDNTTTVSKILPQFEKNTEEPDSGKVFDTKEFTLDLKTKTLSVANEPENQRTFRRFSSSDNSENTDSRKSSVSSVTEQTFVLKPTERNNIDGTRNNYSGNVNASKQDDLLNILNNRISNDTSSTAQARERRRSKDLESSKLTSFLNSERVDSCDSTLSNKVEKSNDSDVTLNTKIPVSRSSNNNRRSVSVNDIRKAFEKAEIAVTNGSRLTNGKSSTSSTLMNGNGLPNHHVRVSSLDSTTSEDSFIPPPSLHKEQFGSVTSIASSTSLISQQELQTLIDEANQVLEETGSCSPPVYEVNVIVLHRETPGGSIGITLAGGADYETKEITVHKVLTGSPADRDGRIQKGDRILSINGRSMKGVTHRESLNILKAPRTEVVLVVSKSRPGYDSSLPTEDILMSAVRTSLGRQLRIPEQLPEGLLLSQDKDTEVPRGPPIKLTLTKDGAGLGFSLEGGKDSPIGDKPLIIKKIFTGGAAEKNGLLAAGDELINVNGNDVTSMSRIEAWSLMKKLPDGNVTLTIRHKAAS